MQRTSQRTQSGKLVFGVPEMFLVIAVVFIEFFVALASTGLATLGVTIQSTNYFYISAIYLFFPIGGFAFIVALWAFGGATFDSKIVPFRLIYIFPLLIGLALMFVITSTVSLIGTSTLFSLFKFVYATAPASLADFITNPTFYLSWIASNAAGEELIFLPPYLLVLWFFGSNLYVRMIDNAIWGTVFVLFHVFKELLIFGSITYDADLFFASAFVVRIMLNELTFWVIRIFPALSIFPAVVAHAGYDVISSISFGAN